MLSPQLPPLYPRKEKIPDLPGAHAGVVRTEAGGGRAECLEAAPVRNRHAYRSKVRVIATAAAATHRVRLPNDLDIGSDK